MTDILESIRRIFVPIHKEGYPFIAIALVAALVLGMRLWSPLGWIGAILTAVGVLLLPRSARASRRCATASWSRRPTAASA